MTTAEATTLERAAGQRRRRKPLFYVLCVAVICLGAAASAFAFTRASHPVQVVAVATTVRSGQTIAESDLKLVDVGSDTGLSTIPASQEGTVIGKVARLDMAAGSIVTPGSFGKDSIPAKGYSVVGLSLTPAQMPASSIAIGDHVSLVAVADNNTGFADDASTIDGTVVGVSSVQADGGGGGDPQTGNSVVDVSVPANTAAGLAAQAANGKVALILNSREQ